MNLKDALMLIQSSSLPERVEALYTPYRDDTPIALSQQDIREIYRWMKYYQENSTGGIGDSIEELIAKWEEKTPELILQGVDASEILSEIEQGITNILLELTRRNLVYWYLHGYYKCQSQEIIDLYCFDRTPDADGLIMASLHERYLNDVLSHLNSLLYPVCAVCEKSSLQVSFERGTYNSITEEYTCRVCAKSKETTDNAEF